MPTAAKAPEKKSDKFIVQQCPACGTKMKISKGAVVKLPDACPVCAGSGDAAKSDPVADDTVLAINNKTLARLSSEIRQNSAAIRRLSTDVRSILTALGMDTTALNSEVPPAEASPKPDQS